MTYTVFGIDPARVRHLYGLSDGELEMRRARRLLVAPDDAVPDRIELRDAPAGASVLLVNYTHQPAENPYRASHAVFVREGALAAAAVHDAVPESLVGRQISLRAFDAQDMLAASGVVDGATLDTLIREYLARPEIAYLHAHYAGPGCYAAAIRRS